MAHLTVKSAYRKLSDRLNRFPQGAPPTELLFQILAMLFSEREAELVSQVPIKPFTAQQAARLWKLPLAQARLHLDHLSDRTLLIDYETDDETWYVLPPPMAGFFEFSLMRYRKDLDQKKLSELFYQYLNVEEDFIKALFTNGDTQLGRTFIQEPALSSDLAIHVLGYERTTEVIETAEAIAVGLCYCRHKMKHLDRHCDAPLHNCLTFNTPAQSLVRAGAARKIDRTEAQDLLQEAYDHRLVQFGENVREGVGFICNCCGCCCEAMIAARKFGHLNPVHTTNFIAHIEDDQCNGCGRCLSWCPVDALNLVTANDPKHPERKKARIDPHHCLGCGVCVAGCPQGSLTMEPRAQRVLTPVNSTHRAIVMAIERGTLHHLIVDNQVLLHHRALAALLGVILKLPPLKQLLASQQFKSRYLERLLQRGTLSSN